jgi:hypothetical protein
MSQSVSCCDQQHNTPFCPDCGRKLREPSTISGLLCHLSLTIKKHRTAINTLRERLEDPKCEQPLKIKKKIAGFEAGIEKHQEWKKAINELREIAEARKAKR